MWRCTPPAAKPDHCCVQVTQCLFNVRVGLVLAAARNSTGTCENATLPFWCRTATGQLLQGLKSCPRFGASLCVHNFLRSLQKLVVTCLHQASASKQLNSLSLKIKSCSLLQAAAWQVGNLAIATLRCLPFWLTRFGSRWLGRPSADVTISKAPSC